MLGEGYDYVALGHIHRYQRLDPDGRVYYSGTPIAVSFEEVYAGNRHCVLLVECSGHGLLPTVTPLEISNPSPLALSQALPTKTAASPYPPHLLSPFHIRQK